jgi:ferredoxin--NADP+ reductase
MLVGSSATPLRVAIIGSGPSAFYAADALLKQSRYVVQVDMFERLPTPFGLVRGGVAPDHAKIKNVAEKYDAIARHPHFRYFGGVEFGQALSLADLTSLYHQMIFAVGAQTDRRMGIPGEDLVGSFAATEFVGWYNGHPDYRNRAFDLSQRTVAVIGNGNVAVDVARVLARTYDELRATDIADYALEALRESQVTDIYMIGRRGAAQAAFTLPELKELGEMADADVVVVPAEVQPDPLTIAHLGANPDRAAEQKVALLHAYAARPLRGARRRIHLRFLASPVELFGDTRVEGLRLVRNVLVQGDDGSLRPRATDVYETMPIGLVFRSIGYMGVALPDLPFDVKRGVIPNSGGRVIDPASGHTLTGTYVVGWIKRGPTGIIGTNRPDAVETVQAMLADVDAGAVLQPATTDPGTVEAVLASRAVRWMRYDDWLLLDARERALGREQGRPRVKFTDVDAMFAALEALRAGQPQT